MAIHIALAPETIAHVGNIPITNSILTTWLLMAVVLVLGLVLRGNLKLVPGKIQSIFESLIEYLYDLTKSAISNQAVAEKIFPLIFTYFFFILIANWFGLLPGVGSIGLKEVEDGATKIVPIFRAPTSDLMTTFALATVSVFVTHYLGIKASGILKYLKRFFNLKSPLDLFVGVLEFISEFSKWITFTFRLFGNIFAGEVLISVMTFLLPVFVPIPFYGLEIFVGFIQAFVFAILTIVFVSIAVEQHGGDDKKKLEGTHHQDELTATADTVESIKEVNNTNASMMRPQQVEGV